VLCGNAPLSGGNGSVIMGERGQGAGEEGAGPQCGKRKAAYNNTKKKKKNIRIAEGIPKRKEQKSKLRPARKLDV
jgi:hypothetical protein